MILSIWWDFQGIIYWEFLPRNSTIDEKPYCQQLESLKYARQVNPPERRKVRLLHDNARVHKVKGTRQKAGRIRVGVLPHSPYWPDMARSDYHLFRSLRNHLVTKCLDDEAAPKSDVEVFFSSLSKKFFEDGIVDLLKRWEYVIDNNGVYVID